MVMEPDRDNLLHLEVLVRADQAAKEGEPSE